MNEPGCEDRQCPLRFGKSQEGLPVTGYDLAGLKNRGWDRQRLAGTSCRHSLCLQDASPGVLISSPLLPILRPRRFQDASETLAVPTTVPLRSIDSPARAPLSGSADI
jgi:hypothetical protein